MEVIGRLASAVIHDLNNLLTVIQLNASLIESGEGVPEDVREAAKKIDEAAQRSADLTRKVLNFARRRPDETEALRLNDVVLGLTRLLEPVIAKRAEIRIDAGVKDLWVRGNQGALEQAVMNLVLNAVDAMPTGGVVEITCREEILFEESGNGILPGDYAVVAVKDNGTGIDPENEPMLFEPFFTTKEFGTGMGLAIVKHVAEMHEGGVEFDTRPGGGTEFRLLIPCAQAPAADVQAPVVAKVEPLRSAAILLVEDDTNIRDLVRMLLTQVGMKVIEAGSGEAALQLWREHRDEVDLLFTDLVLPGEYSGRDLVLAILKERPDLPVLYTSGNVTMWENRTFLNDSNFLPKPFPPVALHDAVRNALAGR